MPASPRRKFGLLDAMILVAGSALCCLDFRLFRLHGPTFHDLYHVLFPTYESTAYLGIALRFAGPWLVALTVSMLLIRLRRPRPGRAVLVRQPGATACLGATVVPAAAGLLAAIDAAILGIPSGDDVHYKLLPAIVHGAGGAVGAVWLVQALGRRWRPEPGWIDRSGRVLGACWIVVFLAGTWDVCWFISLDAGAAPPPSAAEAEATALLQQQEVQQQLESYRLDLESRIAGLERELKELEQRRAGAAIQ